MGVYCNVKVPLVKWLKSEHVDEKIVLQGTYTIQTFICKTSMVLYSVAQGTSEVHQL